MTIGSVLTSLKDDFPDISVSKIRFLEAEGLVTPARTDSGYRTFSAEDVERLRYVLTAQRDRFWPLKVIRDSLDALERGLTAPTAGSSERPRPPEPVPDGDIPGTTALTEVPTLRLTGQELASATGLDESIVEALVTFGLLRPDGSAHFDDAALAVAHAAAGLAAYGIEPRHLRPFRSAADREIGLVQQVVSPLRTKGERSGTPSDPTPDVLRLCIALHTALVKSGLRQAR